MDKKIYLQKIQEMRRKGLIERMCIVCGESNPLVLEKHHIKGRANSKETVDLCKNCHFKNTHHQNQLTPKQRSHNASSLDKIAYQIITQGSLLKNVGKSQIKLGHKLLEDGKDSSKSI